MKRISWLIAFVVLLGFAPSVMAMPQMHNDHMSREEAHKAMDMLSKLAHHPKMIKKLSAEKTIWLLKGLKRMSMVSYAHHDEMFRLQTHLSLHLVDLQVKRLHDFYYDYYYAYDKMGHGGKAEHRGDKHDMSMASDSKDRGDRHGDEDHDEHGGDDHDKHGDDDMHHMDKGNHDMDDGKDMGHMDHGKRSHYGYGDYYDYYGHKTSGHKYGYGYDYHNYYYSYAYDASYYRYHKDASPYGYSSNYGYGYDNYGYKHDYGYKYSSYHYPSVRVKHGKVYSPYKLGINVHKMKFKMAKDCHYAQKESSYKHAHDRDIFVGPCQHVSDYVWTYNVWKV